MPITIIKEKIEFSPGKNILFQLTEYGNDIFISISGGEEHIGAVSFSTEKETFSWTDPPHKEYHITENIRSVFSDVFNKKRIVVLSGIHFNDIKKNEIELIMDTCHKWSLKATHFMQKREDDDKKRTS